MYLSVSEIASVVVRCACDINQRFLKVLLVILARRDFIYFIIGRAGRSTPYVVKTSSVASCTWSNIRVAKLSSPHVHRTCERVAYSSGAKAPRVVTRLQKRNDGMCICMYLEKVVFDLSNQQRSALLCDERREDGDERRDEDG